MQNKNIKEQFDDYNQGYADGMKDAGQVRFFVYGIITGVCAAYSIFSLLS